MTRNPPASTFGTSTLGAWPVLYSVSHEKPCVTHEPVVELRAAAGSRRHGLLGSNSVAIAYWSRSM